MGISAKAFAIWLVAAALVASVTLAAFGQTLAVLAGAAAYGDWRSDAPGMRAKSLRRICRRHMRPQALITVRR
jgi:hypothetical protein